jgi:LIVCS family branched-chain amino acid:cation transporter
MKNISLIISTGLALFSMFFGSGNLIFPIVVGQQCGGHYIPAIVGLLLTGVAVPFLGVFAMLLFDGDSKLFFNQLGDRARFYFTLIALSLMGPFGVLPRCITVAHGAFNLLFSEVSLPSFSFAICLIILLSAISKKKIVSVIGTFLTPIFLISLAGIALFGLRQQNLFESLSKDQWESFLNGLHQGYQTMDLLAAFFFSTFLIQHLKKQSNQSLSVFFKSSLIGAGLLSSIYTLLALLGSAYAKSLTPVPPQKMLGTIAELSLGQWAAPVVAVTIVLACLTTAIILASLAGDFLKDELLKGKISPLLSLSIVLAIAFGVSTLEFSGIAKILGPILEITYPVLIVFTIVSIFNRLWGWNQIRLPVVIAFAIKLLSGAI